MSQYSEQEIIAGCRQNNRVFQELLYKNYYSLFLKICVRYARNREDAEQLVHDGFVKIFTNIGQFRQDGSFEGWMKRVMVNICLDYLKSRQLKDTARIQYTEAIPEAPGSAGYTDVLKQIAFKELLAMIQTLPTMSRTVFNLYVFDGFSHREISTMLQISEGTSSWHVHQARTLLRHKINDMTKKIRPNEKG